MQANVVISDWDLSRECQHSPARRKLVKLKPSHLVVESHFSGSTACLVATPMLAVLMLAAERESEYDEEAGTVGEETRV